MKRILFLVSSCIVLTVSSLNIFAASGDLDRSFGNNGLSYAGDMDASAVIAIQPDDKVISGGQCTVQGQGQHFCLRRFNVNGSIDTTFGTQGRVFTPVNVPNGAEASMIRKIIVLSDGKILAVGYTERHISSPEQHFYQFAVARYNANGTLDTSFEGDGIFADKVTPNNAGGMAYDAVVQPDGKLIVVGGGGQVFDYNFLIARLNTDGSYDTTFNGTGKISTTWGSDGWAGAVALQPDGHILVGGRGGQFFLNVLARYTPTGALDTTFASGGRIIYTGPGSQANNHMKRLVVLPDGKILALSSTYLGAWPSVFIGKLNANGTWDNSFAGGGAVTANLGPERNCNATDLHIQSNGKLVINASCTISSSTFYGHAAVTGRFNQNGTIDVQFGDKGWLTRIWPGFEDSMVVQSDGKLVFGGVYSPNVNSYNFFLSRYLNNGSREADFDNDKKADVSVFRPSNGAWYLNTSSNGVAIKSFGLTGDEITPGDYDGDGTIDVAVYRNGAWYILQSSNNVATGTTFGLAGDSPVAADYDGDGKTDFAIFRNGIWYIINSADSSVRIDSFGLAGDEPIVGNFDGDLKSDLGIYRNGDWYTYSQRSGVTINRFGLSTDKPVAADYDSDGKTDLAVYRDGAWYIWGSHQGYFGYNFGIASDIPSPADYDGDGRTDVGVYRDGTWYSWGTTAGLTVSSFGLAGDVPVPSAYMP